jgi:hypothetical protein
VAGHVRLELTNVVANYPFERSHRFAGIQPNSGYRDYSRLSCGGGGTQLGPNARNLSRDAYCEEAAHLALDLDAVMGPAVSDELMWLEGPYSGMISPAAYSSRQGGSCMAR